MNIDHKKAGHATVTFTASELVLLNNALNEVCNGIHMDDAEFQTRLGSELKDAQKLLAALGRLVNEIHKG